MNIVYVWCLDVWARKINIPLSGSLLLLMRLVGNQLKAFVYMKAAIHTRGKKAGIAAISNNPSGYRTEPVAGHHPTYLLSYGNSLRMYSIHRTHRISGIHGISNHHLNGVQVQFR